MIYLTVTFNTAAS